MYVATNVHMNNVCFEKIFDIYKYSIYIYTISVTIF